MIESRQHDRYDCTHPVWLRPADEDDDAYQLGEAQNISKGGAYVITYGNIRVGQELHLVLEVPDQWGMLSVRAPVRHVQRVGQACYCGVSFEDFGGLGRELFAETMIGGMRRRDRLDKAWTIDPMASIPPHSLGHQSRLRAPG